MPTAAWRPEDDALLARLEDHAILERAWAVLAGPEATPPHPRAAGVVAELRGHPEGAAALTQAHRGELAPLLVQLSHPRAERLTPALAHHLALLHARLARELEGREDEARRAAAVRAWVTSLGLWLWLGEERAYLHRMGESVVGSALPREQLVRAVTDAPLAPLRALGERAREGARALTAPARLALRALARVDEAVTLAGLPPERARSVASRARRERAAAVAVALGRVDAALEEAIVADAPADEIATLLWDGVAVWRWSDRHENVERALIQRTTPYLWERYRAKQWDALRSLLRPLEDPVDHLAQQIARDPTKLAYAAPCAQMIVFRAEVERSFDGQLAEAERAVAVCPTHRNGRLILADLLVERATRAMDRVAWLDTKAIASAKKDLARAEELYPQLKRLPDAKRRLEAALERGRGG